MEATFSGYCRTLDAARMVFCEWEDGAAEIDCDFPACAYAKSCPVGQKIAAFVADTEGAQNV